MHRNHPLISFYRGRREYVSVRPFDEGDAWFGWFVPAATPRALIERIAADASRVLTHPEFRERYILGVALDPLNPGPGQSGELLRADRDRYAQRLKPLNIKLE